MQNQPFAAEDGLPASLRSNDALLTPKQLASLLGVSVVTLTRWRRAEGLGPPFVRLGPSRIGYPVGAYRDWLAAQLDI